MYELLGISLALAGLIALNTVATFFTAMAWRAVGPRLHHWPADLRAQFLFWLRFFPGVIAMLTVAALIVPAYITLEPRHKAEAVSWKLGLLAALSAAGLLLALWRGIAAWVATRRLVGNWVRNAAPMPASDLAHLNLSIPAPVYRLHHSFPVIAVVGVFRPRIFIADHLLESLAAEELRAAIVHECGHLRARDNFKRAVLRGCRDVLTIVPCGRSLDRAWAEAAEQAADAHAASQGESMALDLAAALVKIARIAPVGAKPALPAGALLLGENATGIADRVHRLTGLASLRISPEPRSLRNLRSAPSLTVALLVVTALFLAADLEALTRVHLLIEMAVSSLQ